jgi:LuxR family maltose regulon positive regulatory protein
MVTPLLATKLYIPPPRPHVVHRPRLIERLNEGLHHKLTLVSASAGFGKTTLVSSWIDNLRFTSDDLPTEVSPREKIVNPKLVVEPSKIVNRVAWLSLEEGDSDPTRFLTYLVAAVQTVAPEIGLGVMAALQSPQPPAIEALLTALLNQIATLPAKLILVLDDYHLIDAGGGVPSGTGTVDQAVAFLLDHLPPQLHLVIATRQDPQLPLARLRVRDQLTEVRAADLRFTPAEAAAFLNQMMNLNLSAAEVAALEGRTEGWIAGLQLAALSLQGRSDPQSMIQAFTGSHRFVLDYLLEEVLQGQPEPVRRFLLQTSILDQLNGSLCNALTGQADGSATLARLERGNLFLVPLDDQRQWFRYHHLFADVLRTYLQKELPDQVATLQQRASAWYAEQGQQSAAIRYALAAHDFPCAARLIEREWRVHHRSQFRSAAVLGWMTALPDEMVRASPSLSTGYAWELLNMGEIEAAESHLRDAEQWFSAARRAAPGESVISDEQLLALQVDLATARTYVAQARDDLPGAIAYAQRALDLCPADDPLARALVESLLGLAKLATGDLAGAHHALVAARRGMQQAGNLLFAIGMTYSLADIQIAQGRLRAAVRTYEEALQLAGGPATVVQANAVLQGTADLYLGLGDLHHELGDRPGAREYLQKSVALGEAVALSNWPFRLRLTQARLAQSDGDLAGALKLLDEAEQLYFRVPVSEFRPIAARKARLWIAQGRLHEAHQWATERGLAVDDDLSFLRQFEHITLARLLMASYHRERHERTIQAASGLLARLLQAAEAGAWTDSVIEILLLQALAHQACGDIAQALPTLERALLLAEPEGYVRLFVDEGQPMRFLISDFGSFQACTGGDKLWIAQQPPAEQNRKLSVYANRLLAAFDNEPLQEDEPLSVEQIQIQNPKSKIQNLVEPLSQRELEVLHLIAQGFSNQEIGARLFLALDTVKGHNRRIFDKLQVQRRTEAVAKARSLNLLSLQ